MRITSFLEKRRSFAKEKESPEAPITESTKKESTKMAYSKKGDSKVEPTKKESTKMAYSKKGDSRGRERKKETKKESPEAPITESPEKKSQRSHSSYYPAGDKGRRMHSMGRLRSKFGRTMASAKKRGRSKLASVRRRME